MKIKIVKQGIMRFIDEKETQKWAERGYKRAESIEESKPKATATAKAKSK